MAMIGSPSCELNVRIDGRVWPVSEVAFEDLFESLAEFALMRLTERFRDAFNEDVPCCLSLSSQCFSDFTELTFTVPLLPRLPASHRQGLKEDIVVFLSGKFTDFVDNLVGIGADSLYPGIFLALQ